MGYSPFPHFPHYGTKNLRQGVGTPSGSGFRGVTARKTQPWCSAAWVVLWTCLLDKFKWLMSENCVSGKRVGEGGKVQAASRHPFTLSAAGKAQISSSDIDS